MAKIVINKNLFNYLTFESGHTLDEAAKAIGISRQSLDRRLSGLVPFKVPEMESWMRLVGCNNAGPVFYPRLYEANSVHIQPEAVAVGGVK